MPKISQITPATNPILDGSQFLGVDHTTGSPVDVLFTGTQIAAYIGALPALLPRVVYYNRPAASISNSAFALGSYTVGANAESLEASANVLIVSGTTFNFDVNLHYTDEGGGVRSVVYLSGIANGAGSIPHEGNVKAIVCKEGSTVWFETSGTFTNVLYNIEETFKLTHVHA